MRVSSLDVSLLRPLFSSSSFFSLFLSRSLRLFSLLCYLSSRRDHGSWRVSLRSRDGRGTRVCRAPLKKSIKRRIITEEGVSTHGIYDVLVRGRCCRFTAAAAAATRSSAGCPSPGSGSARTELAYEHTSLRRCTSAPRSSPPRSDDPNIPLQNTKTKRSLAIDQLTRRWSILGNTDFTSS